MAHDYLNRSSKWLQLTMLAGWLFLLAAPLSAQPVAPSSFSVSTLSPSLSSYTSNGYTTGTYGGNYTLWFGRASSSPTSGFNRIVNSFVVSGLSYRPVPRPSGLPFSRVALKRIANPNVSDLGKQSVFFENAGSLTGSNLYYPVEYGANMETVINSFIFNRGTDNIFANSNGSTLNNVERIDLIIEEGVAATDVVKTGFLIMERGGNDAFRVAAITSLDGNGNPASYGQLVLSASNIESNWGSTGVSFTSTVFMSNSGDTYLKPDQNISSQAIAGSYISFQALGIPARTTVYGFSLFPGDVTASMDLVGLSDVPLTSSASSSSTGGLDFMAGGGFFVEENTPIAFSLSGNVFHDTNGLSDNIINGAGINNPGGAQLYAYLVDYNNVVIDKVAVSANGSFVFDNTLNQGANYTVQISAGNVNTGAQAPGSPALPSGWLPVGESYGTNNQQGSGIKSGAPELRIPVRVGDGSITGVNFGINTSRLTIGKTSDVGDFYLPGDTITYTIKIRNEDPVSHDGVILRDTLPQGVSLIPGSVQAVIGNMLSPLTGSAPYTSSTTYTVPAGVDRITVEAWGGGGRGGSRTSSGRGGGGGGGAYSRSNISVTPLASYTVTIGAGSSSANAGADSWFSPNVLADALVLAKGGNSTGDNVQTGADGGSAAESIGHIRLQGGNGATVTSGNAGGGGGSSAGTASAGANASGGSGATAPAGGGNGGAGRSGSNGTGTAGTVPGGGGGGAYRTSNGSSAGGSGANGRVIISYNISGTVGTTGTPPLLASGWKILPGDSLTVTYKAVVNRVSPSDSVVNKAYATSDIMVNPVRSVVTDYLARNSTYAVNDENSTWMDTPVSGNVMTNDFDLEGNTQNFGSFLNPGETGNIASGSTVPGKDANGNPVANAGTLTFNGAGNYTFNPAPGFAGNISVPYSICDNGTPVACDTAYLDITVSSLPAQNNSVIANNDEYFSFGTPVTGNITTNDTDPQGDDFTVTSYRYDSNGDGVPDAAGVLGTPRTVGGVDEYGQPVTNAGTLTQHTDGTFSFTPVPGFAGEVKISYTICDDFTPVACDEAIVTITVLKDNNGPLNDPPVAGDDFSYTTVNTPVNGNFISNDKDLNGDPVRVNGVTIVPGGPATLVQTLVTAQGGTVELYANGTYKYTPPADYSGPDRVVYEICDVTVVAPQPLCAQATIHMLIPENISISGKVWHDHDGSMTLNASETNTTADSVLFVTVLNNQGRVIATAQVNPDGTYEVEGVPALGEYTIRLSSSPGKIDSLFTDMRLPHSWVYTGQNYNGTIISNTPGTIAFSPRGQDVINLDFGIEVIPEAYPHLVPTFDYYPDIDSIIPVLPEYFKTADSDGSVEDIRLTTFPENVRTISIDNVLYHKGNWPEAGITIELDGEGNPLASIWVTPEELYTDIVIPFAPVDNARREGYPATVTLNFNSILPVELLYFSAKQADCRILLSWATASELNNAYFTISSSTDFVNWKQVGKVRGAGTTGIRQQYSYTDAPEYNGTLYYRLAQTDYDGSMEIFPVTAIDITTCGRMNIRVYPVPAENVVYVEHSAFSADERITVTDVTGRVVKQQLIGTSVTGIDLSALPAGTYYLQVSAPNKIIATHKIVVTR